MFAGSVARETACAALSHRLDLHQVDDNVYTSNGEDFNAEVDIALNNVNPSKPDLRLVTTEPPSNIVLGED